MIAPFFMNPYKKTTPYNRPVSRRQERNSKRATDECYEVCKDKEDKGSSRQVAKRITFMRKTD